MKKITIYHNPRCSKSRQALQLLLDHQQQPSVIEYLKQPPSVKDLTMLLQLLTMNARDILRRNEPLYKTLQLDNPKLKERELIQILADNPILIERPIVVVDKQAVIARPPEKVLELL
jgi:arsenate reductase